MANLTCSKCQQVIPEEGNICEVCGSVTINDHAILHEWSRHYDTIQWTVMGILLAGSAALAFSEGTPEKSEMIAGFSLVALSTYAMWSFRSFRKEVSALLPLHEQVLMRSRLWLPQAVVNYAIHVVGLCFWLEKMRTASLLPGCLLTGAEGALILWYVVSTANYYYTRKVPPIPPRVQR